MAIRTGPAEFSKRLVTHESYGGLLPDHLKIEHGRVLRTDDAIVHPIQTPYERDVFDLLRCGWIEPRNRR